MIRRILTDSIWKRLALLLRMVHVYFTPSVKDRVEGCSGRLRTGCPWRDLPVSFGPWQSVYSWFNRHSKKGHLQALFYLSQDDPDDEWNYMDGTYVKAHQHSAGCRKGECAGIGKSRGGLTTKIHMLADREGRPVYFVVTAGNVSDFKTAPDLIDFSNGAAIVGDKGYDSEALRTRAMGQGKRPIIPKRKGKDMKNPKYDGNLYYFRHRVENLFARLKQLRAIATRYDKLLRNYEAGLSIGCSLIWLQSWVAAN